MIITERREPPHSEKCLNGRGEARGRILVGFVTDPTMAVREDGGETVHLRDLGS